MSWIRTVRSESKTSTLSQHIRAARRIEHGRISRGSTCPESRKRVFNHRSIVEQAAASKRSSLWLRLGTTYDCGRKQTAKDRRVVCLCLFLFPFLFCLLRRPVPARQTASCLNNKTYVDAFHDDIPSVEIINTEVYSCVVSPRIIASRSERGDL